jgi:AcrR family transcriptional regulator
MISKAQAAQKAVESQRPYHHGDLRESLLKAAVLVLQREGLDGLSLRAVAREAGVSHAAPAHHFDDMKGLFTALAIKAFEELAHRCERAAADGGLPALCLAYVEMARVSPALFLLMFRNERVNAESRAFAEAGARAYAVLQTHLAQARRKAAAPASDDAAATLTVWSAIHGYSVLEINGRLRVVEQGPKNVRARDLCLPMVERILDAALK